MKVVGLVEVWLKDRRHWYLAIALVVMVGMLLRAAVQVPGFGTLNDPDNYLKLAKSLVEGRGFCLRGKPTAYRPPLYPIVLAPLVGHLGKSLPWGVAILHVLLGGGTVWAIIGTARRWGQSRLLSLLAGVIVAADPVLVSQARMVMTETLAAFGIAVTLLATTARGVWGPTLGGLGFGLASLCRPSLLPGALLTALGSLFVGPGSWGTRLGRAVLLVALTIAVLTPWAWRNARIFGEPIWTTTHGGYTLALANNPVYYDDVLNGPPGAVWTGPNQRRWFVETTKSVMGLREPEVDRRLRAQGMKMLWERPFDFFRAALARLGRFWGVAPADAVYSTGLRLVTLCWTLPLWGALFPGMFRRGLWRWPEIAAPLVILALSAIHTLFWTDLRMRAPVVPAIALVVAAGLTGIERRLDEPEVVEILGKS